MKRVLVVSLMVLLVAILASALILSGCSKSATPTTAPATTSAPATTAAATTGPTQTTAPAKTTAAATTPAAKPDAILIKLGYDTPPTTGLGVPAEFFAKEVNARCEGRVTVQTYPAGTLASQGTGLKNLRAGIADMYVLSFGANLDAFPVMTFTSLPGLNFYPDTEALMKQEVDTVREITNKFPNAVGPEMEGLRLMWNDIYTSAVLMSKGKEIKVPADMKGVKVGCDGMRQNTVTILGGTPVFTIPPQMYQQMQTGVVNAVLVAWGAAKDWQLQELTTYVLDFSFGGAEMPVMMNQKTWNKLSPQDQQIITQVAAEAEQVNRQFNAKDIPAARQKWADTGVKIYLPTAAEKQLWLEKFQIQWEQYKAKNKAAGVTDIEAVFDYWKNAVDSAQK